MKNRRNEFSKHRPNSPQDSANGRGPTSPRYNNWEAPDADNGSGYFNRGDVYENGFESSNFDTGYFGSDHFEGRGDFEDNRFSGQYQGMNHGSGPKGSSGRNYPKTPLRQPPRSQVSRFNDEQTRRAPLRQSPPNYGSNDYARTHSWQNQSSQWAYGRNGWAMPQETRGDFTGRGPKGYTRSDDRIKEEVCEALWRNGDVDATDIEVEVSGGEVTLKGRVENRQIKRLAEDCVDEVTGVREVHNHLRLGEISLVPSPEGDDSTDNANGPNVKGRAA